MFTEPFTGSVSGPLEKLTWDTAGALDNLLAGVGSSQDVRVWLRTFFPMPGWLAAAASSKLGL